MKIRKYVLFSLLIVVTISAFGFIISNKDIYFEITKNLELFGKVYKEISFNYVDEVDPKEFMRAGIKGMLSKLDPYTVFIDEKNQDDIDLLTNGKYGGVGISIGVRNDKVTILEILDGYSAQKQGLRVGDVITSVGDKSVSVDKIDEISSLVKGEPGTSVQLKVLRSNESDTLIFNLIREEVIIKNVAFADFYPENSGNVYIKLTNFSRSAGDELRNALRELKNKKEINSIVLDLRGNPGGLLDVAVDVCDKFLNKDVLIVSTRGKDLNSEKKYFAKEEPLAGNEKLVVLINGNSASASEIVAGAIQDHDRGVILGTQSFGKGLVQTITPLSFNTSLKITTAKYYTPSGRCIQKVDYSMNNKVIPEHDSLKKDIFSTDNKRTVYSAGGITPDTVVEYSIKSDLLKDLLAKGKIFDFADKYYYKNEKSDFKKIDEKKLIAEFKQYLKDSDYKYESETEKKFNELTKTINEKNKTNNIESSLQKIKADLNKIYENEFNDFTKEIISELKIEIASRYFGTNGAIKERLVYDKQFNAALNIFSDKNTYSKLLNSSSKL
ncbi:MAG TPA: S41 family peptidase [Ignavibacteriaceae bacterium]|jgi:carboxyl-terminal processing protease|nr:MAG: Carboxy-terminal processing protease CtpB precursor [Ignavibacteria bacterium ADurb.Bin266]HQI41380.1 S41 family peptidase [Ignavibacteriaceae bacterium]